MIATMSADGGAGYSGSISDTLEYIDKAISDLEAIDVDTLKNMVKLDDDDSSVTPIVTAISNRISELKSCREKFVTDSNKIEAVKNRFDL